MFFGDPIKRIPGDPALIRRPLTDDDDDLVIPAKFARVKT